jgi:hypothetical protein
MKHINLLELKHTMNPELNCSNCGMSLVDIHKDPQQCAVEVVEETHRTCQECKNLFLKNKYYPNQKYCNRKCNVRAWHRENRGSSPRKCPVCATVFPAVSTKVYCNRKCKDVARKRRKAAALRDRQIRG